MSKFLAYSFLYDDAADLKCDFELLSDEIASMIGFLRSLLNEKDTAADKNLAGDLSRINELMYHINPSLRTKVMVSAEELAWLHEKTMRLQKAVEDGLPKGGGFTFFIPEGCTQAAYSHVIRCKCKSLVRLLSRCRQQGNHVDEILFDFTNLYAGYFYSLALWLNKIHGVEECRFTSRVY
ncbi:MAG: ATP--cob(I)alamin adenosyltransferase [Spirochaetaceae bacterium]|jgi:cob(I)alamin adenosyltransferase|nr:ATP--cob(I)alamin adenosyltransferase [Spirochaetaceae bacterium]